MPETLGAYFVERKERGRSGLPVFSVTLENGLVPRDSLDRRTGSSLDDDAHALVEAGDLAYNMMRMWQGALGVADRACLVSPAYVVMKPRPNVDVRFAAAWMKSERGLDRLWAYSHGITDDRLRLYPDDFLSIPVTFPPLLEQRRIAAVLGTWDEAIATAERLAAAGWARKRALMRQLYGDAHNPFMVVGERLDTVVSVEYGRGVSSDSYFASGSAWVVGTSGIIGQLPRGAEEGEAIVVGRKGTLNAPIYVPEGQSFSAIDTTFILRGTDYLKSLFYYLQYIDLSKLNEASGVPSISADTLRSLPVPRLNAKQENLISASDVSAFGARNFAERLRQQKRGLMQKLLTGEWRVPATGDAFAPGGPAADRLEAAE